MEEVLRIIGAHLKDTPGWCEQQKAERMVACVASTNTKAHLELGVYCGSSLMPVALAIVKLQADKGESVSITGVDAWNPIACIEGLTPAEDCHRQYWTRINHEGAYQATRKHLDRFGLLEYTKLVKSSSLDYFEQVEEESLDSLHQDGNHTELVSWLEVELYWNKVKHGGWWFLDDTHMDSLKKAQAALVRHGYVCREEYPRWKVYQRQ